MNNKKANIPENIAKELCDEIRAKNQKKRWPFGIGKMQCHFCWCFGKKAYHEGDFTKLCVFNSKGNRGCWQVNRLYKKNLLTKYDI